MEVLLLGEGMKVEVFLSLLGPGGSENIFCSSLAAWWGFNVDEKTVDPVF